MMAIKLQETDVQHYVKQKQVIHARMLLMFTQLVLKYVEMVISRVHNLNYATMETMFLQMVVLQLVKLNLDGNVLELKDRQVFVTDCSVVMHDSKLLTLSNVMMETQFQGMDAQQHVQQNLAGLAQIHPMFKVHVMRILSVEMEGIMLQQVNNVTMETFFLVTVVLQHALLKLLMNALLQLQLFQFVN